MNFTCPYCNQVTTITEPNYSKSSARINTQASEFKYVRLGHTAIACPNTECKKLYLEVRLSKEAEYSPAEAELINSWNLLPQSLAKPQPDYIPKALREDYYEACAVLPHSPKASATLSRRCLQGIVRDFWDIPEKHQGNLGASLNYIQEKVDPDIWDGIQTIRSVGDIGAHMEKDVNFVVDVEVDEAELLIELIEMLLSEWYVSRQKRKVRAEQAKALASKKLGQKREARRASKESKVEEIQGGEE